MKTRVLLADDHRIFVQSLKDRIERDPSMEVVAESGNGVEALGCSSSTSPISRYSMSPCRR